MVSSIGVSFARSPRRLARFYNPMKPRCRELLSLAVRRQANPINATHHCELRV